MSKKIKFLLCATMFLSIVFSIVNIDWNLDYYTKKSPNLPFTQYLEKDPTYSKLKNEYERTSKLDISKKLKSFKELSIQWANLKIRYEAIEKDAKSTTEKLAYYCESFKKQLLKFSNWILGFKVAFLIVAIPLILRAVLYWGIAPILEKTAGLNLFENNDSHIGEISINGEGEKNLKVEILPKSSLIVVDESFVNGVESDNFLKKSMRWLFSWKYPIMSYFCGLRAMNEYENIFSRATYIDITSDDPDDYFIEIELKDCKGAFILPSAIKAFSPTLNIECKWRLNSLVSWIMFRLRYYVISGSGKLILSASGGFANRDAESGEGWNRRKPSSLAFADSNLKWNVTRTELWYPYIIGNCELFDLLISGKGKYLIRNTQPRKNVLNLSSPESILNVIGKLLGF